MPPTMLQPQRRVECRLPGTNLPGRLPVQSAERRHSRAISRLLYSCEVRMRNPFFPIAALLVLAAFASPLLAKGDSDGSTDQVDQTWAERALANPEMDEGWGQSCHNNWNDDRVAHCEVREFSYSRGKKPMAIDGG